jgi:hypothetical protein
MRAPALRAAHIRFLAVMNKLAHFEVVGKRGFYRPTGKVSFEQAVELVAESMRTARSLGLSSLLVNTLGFAGITPPSIFARHQLALKWAENAGATLHVAMVARAELIDPQKIGVIMAQNRGASGDVFTSETAALIWLDSRHLNKV